MRCDCSDMIIQMDLERSVGTICIAQPFWPSLSVGAKLNDVISRMRGSDQDNARRENKR